MRVISNLLGGIETALGVVDKAVAQCAAHGEYETRTFRGGHTTGCPKCAAERRAQAEREQLVSQRLAGLLDGAQIPKRFAGKTFADFDATTDEQRDVLAKCQRYAENFPTNLKAGRCLLMTGGVGTGKTHLAIAIAKHAIAEHLATAAYSSVGRMSQRIRESYGRGASLTERQILADFLSPDLLVIDEVGATRESSADFDRAMLFEVINGRYEDQLPTIVISNLSAGALKSELGERSFDRLRESGGIGLVFDWKSSRGARRD